jgi:putative transposase
MTSVWVAEHGWCFLNAIIDCCTREIVGWDLTIRCRAEEAIAVIEHAIAEQDIRPGMLTLGTDNGSAFVARATRLVLSGLGVAHRRGGYRDPRAKRSSSHGSATPRNAASGATGSRPSTRPGR